MTQEWYLCIGVATMSPNMPAVPQAQAGALPKCSGRGQAGCALCLLPLTSGQGQGLPRSLASLNSLENFLP